MGVLDVEECLEKLSKGEFLTEETTRELCTKVKEVLMEESNVLSLHSPITVAGDIHGQYYDLLELFRVGGNIGETCYLFLGDYVDRGYHSVETITLLFCLKLRHPLLVFLLRGNHETRQVTQVYGFYAECMKKYGNTNVWKYITDAFDFLPIAATIDNNIFNVHAGLSPSVLSIDQVRMIDRFREVDYDGAITDLLWSDPDPENPGFGTSHRGAGYLFGRDVVERFLEYNNITHILRAHQLCMEGYQIFFDNQLSTVWSAPNYCYRCGNVASILEIPDDHASNRKFKVFSAASESVRLPSEVNTKDVNAYFT